MGCRRRARAWRLAPRSLPPGPRPRTLALTCPRCEQWHAVQDDQRAAEFVLDLLTLAPLVSGKESTRPLHSSCQYFSIASFAASVLLKALVDSYKAAAARHRAASLAGSDPLTYFAAHAPVARVSDDDEPIARIALLLSHKGQGERVGWEIKCAKAMLRSAQELVEAPSARGQEYQRASLYSYKPMSPLIDRHDGLWELLHGHVGDSWRQQLRSTRPSHSKEQPMFHLVIDMLSSAPLAHARVHRALFKRAWSPSSVHSVREVLLELLGKRGSLGSNRELGLSMHDGKFGNGRSIFSTYADLEVNRAHDPLVQGHDDEWTQMRRIDEAQRDIEAKVGGMQAPFEEMSGGINGSMFFSMAAVEKKLELKIPPPVYPEMRKKAQPPAPAKVAPKEEVKSPPEPTVVAESAPTRVEKPAWGKSALSFADILRKGSESSGAHSEVDDKRASQQASKWPRPHDADSAGGVDSEVLPANRPKQTQPSPSLSPWGQRKAWGVQGQTCSAAQAAQAATGVLFAQPCQEIAPHQPPAWPSAAHAASSAASSHGPARAPENKEEMTSNNKTSARDETASKRLRYNPLRPQHAPLAQATDTRRATARRLHVEMLEFLREVEPTQCSRRHRDEIVEQVKAAVAASCPDASVEVYGSYATDLFLAHSDVDLLVMHAQPSKSKSPLQVVSEHLRGMTWCRYIKTIETILVPVVKVTADVSLLDSARSVAEDKQIQHADTKDEEQRACIAVDVTFDCNIGDAPLRLRDFVCEQLKRFPIIRPLVLVLKHLLFKQGLNDYYKGGLSSHSVVLLLIFYFSIPEVAAAHEAGLDKESDGYIDEGCWYGEWLMRLMQWLSEFPFSDVGIAVEPMSYVPLTDYGYGMLIKGECDPDLPDVDTSGKGGGRGVEGNVLHIEDPFNKDPVDPTKPSNIAQGCFEWYLVRRCLQGSFRILSNHKEPAPHMRIFGGVAESPSPLASILDRTQVTSSVAALLKEQADKRVLPRAGM